MQSPRRGFLASVIGALAALLFGSGKAWTAESPPLPQPPKGMTAVKFVERVEFDEKTCQLVVFEQWIYLPDDCVVPGV